MAYVAQDPLIPDDMCVSDYVLLGRTPYVGYFGTESATDRDVVADVIDRLRLGAFAARMLGSMSGGERQRAVLARALAQEAPVLLLDEPTSALDIGHQQQALELVTELREHSGLDRGVGDARPHTRRHLHRSARAARRGLGGGERFGRGRAHGRAARRGVPRMCHRRRRPVRRRRDRGAPPRLPRLNVSPDPRLREDSGGPVHRKCNANVGWARGFTLGG